MRKLLNKAINNKMAVVLVALQIIVAGMSLIESLRDSAVKAENY